MTDDFPSLRTPDEALAFALESQRISRENARNLWPWRVVAFWRTWALVQRRIRHSDAENRLFYADYEKIEYTRRMR